MALIHPIVMGGLLVYTLWAGYLGWQSGGNQSAQARSEANRAEGAPPLPVEVKIKELTEERKQLVKGGYWDMHFNVGSILLAFGVLEAVGGCVNTWFRTGKLFPGPHLFPGASSNSFSSIHVVEEPDTVTGDIVFVLHLKEHPKFKSKHDDLFLNLTKALCGFQFVVP